MLEQLEVLSVKAEVLQDTRVVHVVGVICWNGEVAETHHLLGGIDGQGLIDTCPVGLRDLLHRKK